MGVLKSKGQDHGRLAYLTLQLAYQQVQENLTRLVAMADILERFRSILAPDVEKHFFAATAKRQFSDPLDRC